MCSLYTYNPIESYIWVPRAHLAHMGPMARCLQKKARWPFFNLACPMGVPSGGPMGFSNLPPSGHLAWRPFFYSQSPYLGMPPPPPSSPPSPLPLPTLTSHWPRKKTKKTRCRGLDNYFKAAVCLILGSNTPPPPPHAPPPGMGWGGWGI